MIDQLLTVIEVAALLKVNRETVRKLPIPRSRIGGMFRYRPMDVERYVSSTMENQVGAIKKPQLSKRSPRSKALGTPEILSWADLQRIAPG